jgi:hypothetical protein
MSRVGWVLLWITVLAIPAAFALGLSLWLAPDEKTGLEKLYYACATAFGMLGAVAALTLVWVFLREGTRAVTALKSAAYSQVYGRLADLTKALMHGCEKRDWFADPSEREHERDQDPRSHLCDLAFNLFEEVYYQRHKFRLLDREDWRGWLRTIQLFMSRRYAIGYWRIAQSQYPEHFVRAMNRITAGKGLPEKHR